MAASSASPAASLITTEPMGLLLQVQKQAALPSSPSAKSVASSPPPADVPVVQSTCPAAAVDAAMNLATLLEVVPALAVKENMHPEPAVEVGWDCRQCPAHVPNPNMSQAWLCLIEKWHPALHDASSACRCAAPPSNRGHAS